MKILHVIPTYLPAYRSSGPINLTHGMNKWLVRNGIEVTVYTTAVDAPHERLEVPLGTPVYIDGVRVFYFPVSFPRRWFYSRELRRKLATTVREFDLVHVTSVFLAASTLVARRAVRAGVPFIISFYGTFMRVPLKYHAAVKRIYIAFVERWNLAHADALHFVTRQEEGDYLAAGLPLRRGVVIPSGVDPETLHVSSAPEEFRKKFNIPADARVILFFGRLFWIKGLDTLIPAFAGVARMRPDAVLVLAGYGESGYEREVGQLIDENGVRERVRLTGPLFGADKENAFAASDVFVLPSYTEAASISSIEALFFGLPVVITENCGLAREIAEVGAGLMVPKETEAVRDALIKVLSDPAAAAGMRRSAKSFADSDLMLDGIAKRFIGVYTEIIKGRSGR